MTTPSIENIDFNMKPKNIIRYRKAPLVLAVIAFGALLFYLILQLSHRTDARREEAKQRASQTTGLTSTKQEDTYWFQDQKYDHISPLTLRVTPAPSTITETNTTSAINPPPELDPSPASPLPSTAAFPPNEQDTKKQLETLRQSQMVEQEKMQYEAIRASARVAIPGQSITTKRDNNAALQSPPASSSATASTSISNDQDQKQAFLNHNQDDETYLRHTKTAPLSRTEMKAGTVIPAALITALNSDLPGSIIGQVRENVYDTVSGNLLLIPQGAKLIGQYDAHVSFGQNRALVVWNRLIFPDGKSITLERMQGADASGYAGFTDRVNNHYGRIYGSALLMSLMGSGYELLNKDVGNYNIPSTTDTVAAAIGQQIAQVSNQMIRKNLAIQPTIDIRSGYKFNVLVMKDVILEDLGQIEE